MSRIDKTQVSDAIRLLSALRREAKLTDKVVAKLVGKLAQLPQLREELPSPRYLRQITEAAEELDSALGHVVRARRQLPSVEQIGRLAR
jgi:hypothetical protein